MTALVLAILAVAAAVMAHAHRTDFWPRWSYSTLMSSCLTTSVVALLLNW